MNDNGCRWRAAEFQIDQDYGSGKRTVRGFVCAVFGVHDDALNGVPSFNEFRISITHLPTGLFIGRAPHGAAAYEIVEQLMPLSDDFARALHPRDLSHLASKIADIFDARGCYTNARRYA